MRCAWIAIALVGCGAASARPDHGTGIALSYDVSIDAALSSMHVSVCPVDAPLPRTLVPLHDEAREHLRSAELVLNGALLRELPSAGRIDLTDAPASACVRYEIDLTTCSSPHAPTGCARSGRDLFAPTSVWLFAPETRRMSAHYDLRFILPEGVSVTPIAEGASSSNDHVVLDDRSFAFVTYLAFVHSAPRAIAVPGGCIDVVTLDGALDASFEARTHWLATAAGASTRVTGRAPFDRLTALIVPTFDVSSTPVVFGVAGRGMRPTVTLLVSEHATEAQLVPDWTTVHELSHFLTTYVDGQDTWLSEGLATYYEEVLRVRARLLTEEQGWTMLERGFARGREASTSGTLRTTSSTMQEAHAYARVYWQGAAMVFLADVAYRRAGSSLDEAIARAWAHRSERGSAAELAAWLDGVPNGPFAEVVLANIDAEGFPDLRATYAWLGVVVEDGVISLDDAAPGASIRHELMNGSVAVASNPASCDAALP